MSSKVLQKKTLYDLNKDELVLLISTIQERVEVALQKEWKKKLKSKEERYNNLLRVALNNDFYHDLESNFITDAPGANSSVSVYGIFDANDNLRDLTDEEIEIARSLGFGIIE